MDTRAAPARPRAALRGQVGRFAVIGVVSTLLTVVLFAALSFVMPAQLANAASLIIATVLNTAANRRFTFGVTERGGRLMLQVRSLVLLAMTIACSAGALHLLHLVAPDAHLLASVVAFVLGNAVATVVRFFLLRRWVTG